MIAAAAQTTNAWRRVARSYRGLEGEAHTYFLEVFFPEGRAPEAGEVWRNPDLAQSLGPIAGQGPGWFYRGGFAQALERFARTTGGYLRA